MGNSYNEGLLLVVVSGITFSNDNNVLMNLICANNLKLQDLEFQHTFVWLLLLIQIFKNLDSFDNGGKKQSNP